MSNHTPGPWHTFRQGTKHFVSQSADEEFRFAHAVIFETNYHPDNIVAARNEAEANARLIAAAPDLLAMLVEIVGQENPNRWGYDAAHKALDDDWRAQARAAIAKATGEVKEES